jgi:hypothetical protein
MKSILILAAVALLTFADLHAQELKIITVVESIVPAGIGRSRIIEHEQDMNYEEFTTERTDGKKSNQSDIRRKDLKLDEFKETKLLNFYSLAGINFQNIASNDAIISDKLTEMVRKGWQLLHTTSAVESNAGADDGEGIFITRFVFIRPSTTE